jgi:hypothetical protein
MARNALLLVALAALLTGCGSGGPTPKAATAPPKGAKVRVFNVGLEPAPAWINGQTMGRPVESDTATPYRLASAKQPIKMKVGETELDVEAEPGGAYTVVYFGAGDPQIVKGEPTDVAKGKAVVYFGSLLPGATQATLRPGAGREVVVALDKSEDVPPTSYTVTVKLEGGKELTQTVDIAGGEAYSVFIVGDAAAPRLVVLLNNEPMRVMGAGGASPVG